MADVTPLRPIRKPAEPELAERGPMRAPGRRMRSRLLDAAVGFFKVRGPTGVSFAEIAAAAGAHPSQLTYYFRTKEALFVEAACREVLYVAAHAEAAAAEAETPAAYRLALIQAVIGAPGLTLFVEALALARRRQDLGPLIERTFERLYAEGARAYGELRHRRGWAESHAAATTARRFWTIALGLTLHEAAAEIPAAEVAQEMLALLGAEPGDVANTSTGDRA